MRHVVFFSSGIASWVAAKRVVERYGTSATTLVFADTLIEDEDNYRFLEEAAKNVGAPLVVLKDGRDPWQVFKDDRFLGNSRLATCSKRLKQETCRKYIESINSELTLHLGIDWQEAHRADAIVAGWAPRNVDFPLMWEPWLSRPDYFDFAQKENITPPRLYEMGFAHANCGGFCVKGGHSAFAHLLKHFPERYEYHERKEDEIRQYLDKNVAIMRDRSGGKSTPMTMKMFRERQAPQVDQLGLDDWGGCNCFAGSE